MSPDREFFSHGRRKKEPSSSYTPISSSLLLVIPLQAEKKETLEA